MGNKGKASIDAGGLYIPADQIPSQQYDTVLYVIENKYMGANISRIFAIQKPKTWVIVSTVILAGISDLYKGMRIPKELRSNGTWIGKESTWVGVDLFDGLVWLAGDLESRRAALYNQITRANVMLTRIADAIQNRAGSGYLAHINDPPLKIGMTAENTAALIAKVKNIRGKV